MASITLTIDGQEVSVAPGTSLREAAARLGIATPTLCHHPYMDCGSNCRVCVVELEGSRVLVPACSRQAAPGMRVQTDSPRVRRARKVVLELLLSSIDHSAADSLHALAARYGALPHRFAPYGARAPGIPPRFDNPFFVRDYARCIVCQRCTVACGPGIQHTYAIAVTGRGLNATIGAGAVSGDLPDSPCVFCGNCVGVCPTGALMARPEYEARLQGVWPPAPAPSGDGP